MDTSAHHPSIWLACFVASPISQFAFAWLLIEFAKRRKIIEQLIDILSWYVSRRIGTFLLCACVCCQIACSHYMLYSSVCCNLIMMMVLLLLYLFVFGRCDCCSYTAFNTVLLLQFEHISHEIQQGKLKSDENQRFMSTSKIQRGTNWITHSHKARTTTSQQEIDRYTLTQHGDAYKKLNGK